MIRIAIVDDAAEIGTQLEAILYVPSKVVTFSCAFL